MRKKHILNTFGKKAEKKWDTLYWAVDIHDTCIKANYKSNDLPTEFFPLAKEALLKIGSRPDCCLVLFTCSHPHEIEKYLEFFKSHGINFKYVNKNPEAANTAFGFFEDKFYTNFILDDKAGFDPATDWKTILDALDEVEYYETTPPALVKKHILLEKLIPVFLLTGLIVAFAIAILISTPTLSTTMTCGFIAMFFGGFTLWIMRISEKSPLRFHMKGKNQ
jgi:hypothetical protein